MACRCLADSETLLDADLAAGIGVLFKSIMRVKVASKNEAGRVMAMTDSPINSSFELFQNMLLDVPVYAEMRRNMMVVLT